MTDPRMLLPGDPFEEPRHRDYTGLWRWARITLLAVALSFLGAFFVGSIAPLAAHAATLQHRPPAVTWEQRTCAAFTAWEKHPGPARLVTLGTDSLRVPWKYLGADVWQLVNDVHAHPKYVSDDIQYIYQDCHDGYGL